MSHRREHTLQDAVEEVRRVSEDVARARDEEGRAGRIGPIRKVCLAAIMTWYMKRDKHPLALDSDAGTLRYRLGEREYTITVTVEDA